jgi:hypothetical protein
VGTYADLKAIYQLNEMAGGVTPYLALDGNVTYCVVNTTQTQYWYGNEDFLKYGGPPKGTRYTGIGHVITNAQFQIGLRLGFSF